MVLEVQKYRAQFFQILGFSFMTPCGKMILNLFDLEPSYLSLKFLILFIISPTFAFLGIILNVKGINVLEGKG